MIGLIVAWQGHTDASRELAQDIATALDRTFGKRDTAAAAMGLHKADLSRQISGRDPLNAWRLAGLGPVFWLHFLIARAARLGAELFTADQLAVIRGAAHMGPRMLSSVLHRKERAS